MNRLGIVIDISHSTDSTVFDVLQHSKAPVAASHSSCRYFCPGLERNLPDTLIKAIAAKNGVIMVNFGSFFLDSVCTRNWDYLYDVWPDSTGKDLYSQEWIAYVQEYGKTHKLKADSKQVADHIDHIVKLVGTDHNGGMLKKISGRSCRRTS